MYDTCELLDVDATLVLREVRMVADTMLQDRVCGIDLTLDAISVSIDVNMDDDSLVLAATTTRSTADYVQFASTFWASLIGYTLVEAWCMRNIRGRLDAIQLHFRQQPNQGEYRLVQLYGIASAIRITEMSVTRSV